MVTGEEEGKCCQSMKARLRIDSIGSHSSWHVEYYLHISLWKLSRLCGGQGWSPPSCQCVELSLARRHIVSPLALCPLCFSCFRTIFPVSNLFISQDPRLSYLHDHCKCNVNESSDKIFLYFVISKEFLYRRTQWKTCMHIQHCLWVVFRGGPGSPAFFSFFYTNLLHVSETFFKGIDLLWLSVAKKKKINYYTQSILCSISS